MITRLTFRARELEEVYPITFEMRVLAAQHGAGSGTERRLGPGAERERRDRDRAGPARTWPPPAAHPRIIPGLIRQHEDFYLQCSVLVIVSNEKPFLSRANQHCECNQATIAVSASDAVPLSPGIIGLAPLVPVIPPEPRQPGGEEPREADTSDSGARVMRAEWGAGPGARKKQETVAETCSVRRAGDMTHMTHDRCQPPEPRPSHLLRIS